MFRDDMCVLVVRERCVEDVQVCIDLCTIVTVLILD